MYNYDILLKKLKLENNDKNRKYIKAIVHALIKNGDAEIIKQAIDTDFTKIEYLFGVLMELTKYFDYRYSSKIDLTKFLLYILNDKDINIEAIFCPGYTSNGYKKYVGRNNTNRMWTLRFLADELEDMEIQANFKIVLADIFLENTDDNNNPMWREELTNHREIFHDVASKYFSSDSIINLSDVYKDESYIEGFVDESLCQGRVYNAFYKNNLNFYTRMHWDNEQIKHRNDRLFTIYSIVSQYINQEENGVYIPMETMYSRSKVMTKNDVCTMYLRK